MPNIFRKNNILTNIPLEDIAPNKYQPRQYFDDESLKELKNSILEFGLLQPVTVRKSGIGYELVAGERRFRAAQLAGLDRIPAIVIKTDEKKSAILSLLENLQREDLTFFEVAQSYERLIREQGMTQSEVAEKLGKSQSSVANKLRLLRLSPMIKKLIRDYNLTERHARALLKLRTEAEQFEAIKNICIKSLSVAETEALINEMLSPALVKQKIEQKGSGNLSFFKNTVKKAVDIMKKGGIDANMIETDFEWGTEYKICVKKEKESVE